MNPSRQVIKPPDKGSFPLDHFHDCNREAEEYTGCMQRHQMMPKRCRQFQKSYLECRMKAGLMEQTDMKNLGFGDELDWKNEEEERRTTFSRIEEIKRKAQERVSAKYGNPETPGFPTPKAPEDGPQKPTQD